MIIHGSIHNFILVNQLVLFQWRKFLDVGAVVVHRQTVSHRVIPDAEVLLEVLEQVLHGLCRQACFHIALYLDASFKIVIILITIISIDSLLFTIKFNVKAFLYITTKRIHVGFRLKRELDIDVAAVLIHNSVAHHPNKDEQAEPVISLKREKIRLTVRSCL